MPLLVSIDPGVVCTGFALWSQTDTGMWTLVRAGLSVRPGLLERAPLEDICLFHSGRVFDHLSRVKCDVVVVEQQTMSLNRDRRAPIAKGNDLLAVQAVGMAVAGQFGGRLIYPTVSDWLGSVSTDVTQERVLGTLQPYEASRLADGLAEHRSGLHHNAYDSVALGLWATKRYRSGRAIPPPLV